MVTSLAFGFSSGLTAALVNRAFAGLGGGNGGIIRTAVAELVPQRELQPRAFSIVPLTFTVGSMLGPAFGGFLANAATKYPTLFGNSQFLRMYPYALPNLAAGGLFAVTITVCALFFRETLDSKRNQHDLGLRLGRALMSGCQRRKSHLASFDTTSRLERTPLIQDALTSLHSKNGPQRANCQQAKDQQPQPQQFSWSEVFSRQSQINLLEYGMLAMHSVACDQLLPIFMHHPRADPTTTPRSPFQFTGGFGIDSGRIGFLLMLNAFVGIFIQFILFPPVAKNLGILNCLKACALAFPVLYILIPFTALIRSPGLQQGIMFVLMVTKSLLTIFAWPCSTILLSNSAASPQILGTLNGVATSVGALGRTIGPAIGGVMFTVGLDVGSVVVPWWTVGGIAAVGALPVFWLKETPDTVDTVTRAMPPKNNSNTSEVAADDDE
ncbi:hypothetical protein MMC18_006397 [Xylographa bjoerkii]|nr:hypothetical protein [Xylographa bjoerkii]